MPLIHAPPIKEGNTMNWVRSLLDSEAVMAVALVTAVANLAVAFGLELSAEQVAGINALIVAVGAVIARAQVWSGDTHRDVLDREMTNQSARLDRDL